MVIHDNIDADSTSSTLHQPNLAPKKYVVVKNHVREINKSNDNAQLEKNDNYKEITEEKDETRKRKSESSDMNQQLQHTEDNDKNSVTCEISKRDLNELRQVYIQCKNVIKKIEAKYGHLLDLSDETPDSEEECNCNQNKKIVFNDDGNKILKDCTFEKHICLKRLKPDKSISREKASLDIEYTMDYSSELPDSLIDLGNLLKEPIDFRLRRFVIDKIKGLRQDYINELKDDKHLLVKKLKENPTEDLLGFEGTNLSTITGYLA